MSADATSFASTEASGERPPRRVAIAALLLVLLLGGGVARFHALGGFSFWTDEMYHVVAARSVVDTGRPVVPGRGEYWRAYPVTWITAVGFRAFGVSEAVARAPFAILNLAFAAIAFVVVRRQFSTPLAFLVLLVLLFSPHELRIARECRMYGLLQLLYFAGSFLILSGLETGASELDRVDRSGAAAARFLRPLLLLGAGGLLLVLGIFVQPLAVNFGITLAIYCAVIVIHRLIGTGAASAVRSPHALALALLAVGTVIVEVAWPGRLMRLLSMAQERQVWDTGRNAVSYYRWFFLYYYPAFTFIAALGALVLVNRYGRRGVFVICSFLPLMVAHLFVFTGHIEERYLAYILPFFFIAACGAVEPLAGAALRRWRAVWREGRRALAVLIAAALIPAGYLFAHPWLGAARDEIRYGIGLDWKEFGETLRSLSADHVVISTWPREMLHYGGRFPDHILTRDYEYGGDEHEASFEGTSFPVRWVRDAETLEQLIADSDRIWVIATAWSYENEGFLDDGMRSVIERTLTRLDHGGDDEILVFSRDRPE